MQTRVDRASLHARTRAASTVAAAFTAAFVLLEFVELSADGVVAYFSNLWNVMDWVNFLVFVVVWLTLHTLSRELDAGGTKVGTQMGTPPYMSPERVEGRPYGRGCDVWAVGVVLFELLALVKPFEGGTLLEVARQIGRGEPSERARRALEAATRIRHRAAPQGAGAGRILCVVGLCNLGRAEQLRAGQLPHGGTEGRGGALALACELCDIAR